MNNYKQEAQAKLTKGLLDMIVLQNLEHEDMHGYQLITKIRKDYGTYFGPSTVYPLLSTLEKKGYVKSTWDMTKERPRKVFKLTEHGKAVLSFTGSSLAMICRNLNTENVNETDLQVRPISKIS